MDEILFDSCKFCNSSILSKPIITIDGKYKFCCVVCAKIYNDSFEKIQVDYKNYTKNYLRNELDKNNKQFYESHGDVLFEMLPVAVINKDATMTERNRLKDEYIKTFR